MTDLEQRLRGLSDQPIPASPSVERVVRRGRTLRVRRRAMQAGGGALALGVAVLALVIGGLLAPSPSVVLAPPEPAGVVVPEGWKTVTLGEAALSVPDDWPVSEVRTSGPVPHPEHIFREGPAVYLAERMHTSPGPPATDDAPPRQPGVYLLPASSDPVLATWVAAGASRVSFNGHEGLWKPTEEFRWYLFHDLDLLLWVSYDPDPALMDQVLGTLRWIDPNAMDAPPGAEGVARAETPNGQMAIEVVLDNDVVRSDELVVFRLVNRGSVTVMTGSTFAVEHWDGQRWTELPVNLVFDSMGRMLDPGAVMDAQQWPSDPRLRIEPGWYRIVKSAWHEDPDYVEPDVMLSARTRFRVVGPQLPPAEPDTEPRRNNEEPIELGPREDWTLDDLYYAVGREVPAFAGLYFDGGTLVIQVTDASQDTAELARAMLIELDPDYSHLAEPPVRAGQVRYSWVELYTWYRRLSDELHTVPGWFWSDIDEKANRIAIGLEDPRQGEPHARAAADRVGIPADALHVE